VVDEVILGQPEETARVGIQMLEGARHRALRENGSERLIPIQTERGDIDKPNHIARISAECGGSPDPRNSGLQGWSVPPEYRAPGGDGQRRRRARLRGNCGARDLKAVRLKAFDHPHSRQSRRSTRHEPGRRS